MKYKNPYILGIMASAPIFLWAILLILPTYDDWTTLSLPNYEPDYLTYILPYGMTWRPFDAIMGYVNAIDYHLYPTLNHVLIFMAHLGSTFGIYKLTQALGFRMIARNIATLFFYVSPCTMGTILSCDALNQSFSHLWGILAVFIYLTTTGKKKYIAWIACTYMSVLSKDNGLAWAIVPPIIACAFDKIDKKTFKKELAFGFGIALSYGIIRLSIPNTYVKNGSYEEDVASLHSRIKGLVSWISYTWFAADYIAIVNKPSRNLYIGILTTILSCLFMLKIWWNKGIWRKKQLWLLLAAFIIVASPHLLISMSIMNTYSSLGMAALIIGFLCNENKNTERQLQTLFFMYLTAAIITDVHHWYKAWQTSLPGKKIAEEIVRKTGKPAKRVYCILVRDENPKFSSFCVPIDETLGWGRAVWPMTAYKWPVFIQDTTLEHSADAQIQAIKLAKRMKTKNFDCVWIINKENVEVIK